MPDGSDHSSLAWIGSQVGLVNCQLHNFASAGRSVLLVPRLTQDAGYHPSLNSFLFSLDMDGWYWTLAFPASDCLHHEPELRASADEASSPLLSRRKQAWRLWTVLGSSGPLASTFWAARVSKICDRSSTSMPGPGACSTWQVNHKLPADPSSAIVGASSCPCTTGGVSAVTSKPLCDSWGAE